MTVGASLLAKIVNDNAAHLNERGGLGLFASKLAPTVVVLQSLNLPTSVCRSTLSLVN
ncbi:hypothetical protein [Pseudomonas sp. 24 E 13]|nr:hypothetical protein [Pseudomonas sp. 24 E 13]